jgi:hypothetical protein
MKSVVISIKVTVVSENETGKMETSTFYTDTIKGGVRALNTFKAKKGYEPVKFTVEKVDLLV